MTSDDARLLADRVTALTEEVKTAVGAHRACLDAVVSLVEADPHQWSSRPCQTCASITTLVGYPFGCSRLAKLEATRRRTSHPLPGAKP